MSVSTTADAPVRKVGYLRVTVLGTTKNADLVLPTDQPVAMLLPQLLDLLREPARALRSELVTITGEVIDPSTTLGETDLVDGAQLRLVAGDEVPPAPLVHELLDSVEQVRVTGTWNKAGRAASSAAVASLLLVAATTLGVSELDGDTRTLFLAGVAAASYIGAALLARTVAGAAAWMFTGLGVVMASAAIYSYAGGSAGRWIAIGLAVAATTVTASICTGQPKAAIVALGVLAVLSAVALVIAVITADEDLVGGTGVVAALFALGILPRSALASSGVFRVDAAITAGREVTQRSAAAQVAQAHWSLLGAVVVSAFGFAIFAMLTAHGRRPDVWTAVLICLTSTAFALRGRHFPLSLERATIWLGALAGPLTLVWEGTRLNQDWVWPAAGALLVIAAAALATTVVEVGDHAGAQLRRVAGRLESLTVLSAVPVLLGVFGVYQDLLTSFN